MLPRLILLLVLTHFCHLSVAQDWEGDVVWIYSQEEFRSASTNVVRHVKVLDTVIQNRTAIKVEREWFAPKTSGFGVESYLYFSYGNGVVEYYDFMAEEFYPLYDFNLEVGDTLSSVCLEGTTVPAYTRAIIDSISMTTVNGESRKVQHLNVLVDPNIACSTDDRVIEGVGFESYFLPQHAFADPVIGGSLLCYQDRSFTFPISSSCDLSVGVNDIVQKEVDIFPNPVYDQLNIEGERPVRIELYNMAGVRMNIENGIDKISLAHLPNGIYILRLQYEEGYLLKRFVKNANY